MIISPDFVWLHFPKCAGSFTEKLLRKVVPNDGSFEFDPIDPQNVIWHHTVKQREKYSGNSLAGKDIICNFRRLPDWVISRIQYERQRSGQNVPLETYRKGCFFEQNGKENNADTYINRYTEIRVDHWIRVEYLREDFTKVFSKYFILNHEIIEDFVKIKVNVSEWDGDIFKWFKPDDLKILYDSCPLWADLEKELYGDLIS